jgi:LPXTG-site transpeptidase (sortase) family protein
MAVPASRAIHLKGLERSFRILGLALIAGWGITMSAIYLHQRIDSRRLEDSLSGVTAQAGNLSGGIRARAARAEAAGTGVIGRIDIPRLGLAGMVEEGVDRRTLLLAVGHLPGTPFPGEAGNVCLAGHRDSFFRELKDIRSGDTIRLTTPDGIFDYRTESIQVVDSDDNAVLGPTGKPSLTLVTCYPFYYIGHAPKRFIVQASLIGGSPENLVSLPSWQIRQ